MLVIYSSLFIKAVMMLW